MTDQITKLLDDVQRLDEQATQGPWTATGNDYGGKVYEPSGYPLPGCTSCGENEATYQSQDAEFIALSRTFVPAASKALRAVLELLPMADDNDEPQYAYNLALKRAKQTITDALEADGVV